MPGSVVIGNKTRRESSGSTKTGQRHKKTWQTPGSPMGLRRATAAASVFPLAEFKAVDFA